MADDKEYEVGYKKPPQSTKFKPGQSGNPKGRPPGSKNFKTDLQEELNQLVQINSNGKSQSVSKQRAIIMRTVEMALNGDARAIDMISKMIGRYIPDQDQSDTTEALNQDEKSVFENILSRCKTEVKADKS